MSDQIRTLSHNLISKLESFQFRKISFIHTTEQFLSSSNKKNTYSTLTASGNKENHPLFLSTLTPEEESVELNLTSRPEINDPCPDLLVKQVISQEPQTLCFSESDPKVYLLDFWATWCGPCQGPMSHNQEMLEKNPAWEGKAEIIAISLDNSADAVQRRVTEKGWTKLVSYWAGPEGFESEAAQKFDVAGIPTCVLVFKGKVLWIGHPSKRDLESDINSLIQQGEIKAEVKDKEVGLYYSEETHSEMLERGRARYEEFVKENPTIRPPDVASVRNFKISQGEEPVIEYKFFILGRMLRKYKETGEKYVRDMTEIFPNASNRLSYEESSVISRGEVCSLCSQALDHSAVQYLCVFCEPFHYHCEKCHVRERAGQGSARLAHPHSLYRIGPESERLDEIKCGRESFKFDSFYEEEPDKRSHEGVCCDNAEDPESKCDGAVVGVRYRCVHCFNYDFCEKCFRVWVDAPCESMVSLASKQGHYRFHVWALIEFPYK